MALKLTESEFTEFIQRGAKAQEAIAAHGPGPKNGLRHAQALGRLKSGELNKTEQQYDAELQNKKLVGEVLWYRWHCLHLKLANGLFYRPDVLVLTSSLGLEVHEVKGWWTDDSAAKVKVAADKFPFRFIAVSKQTKKDGGGWAYKEF